MKTEEKPLGLEANEESKQETQEERKRRRGEEERRGEKRRRGGKGRRREESAGAREEQSRAQEAREERRAQKARQEEEEAKNLEERRKQEREVEAQGGHEGEVKAQGGHEGEVKAQGRQEEDVNSVHEESHKSNRYMTWWRNVRWIRVDHGPHMRSARGRRKTWRAARQAAEHVAEGSWVEETRRRDGGRDRRRGKGMEKGGSSDNSSSNSRETAAIGSPSRLCSSLCIPRLTSRSTICTSWRFERSPSCISSSTFGTSLKVCGRSRKILVDVISQGYQHEIYRRETLWPC